MDKYALDFAPPLMGLDGQFNTFRLGVAWTRRVQENDTLLLINRARSLVIGRARIHSIDSGKLSDMASKHAMFNHNHKGYSQTVAAERLVTSMIKRYGPQKCNEDSKVTVLYMEIIEHAPE